MSNIMEAAASAAQVAGTKKESKKKEYAPTPDFIKDRQQEMIDIKMQIAKLEARNAEIKAEVLEYMQENGMTRVENEYIRVNVVKAGVSKRFDSKRFKAEHEDVYNQYIKETEKEASITVNVK